MNSNRLDNPMRRNVWDLPQLCVEQCSAIEKETRLTLSTPEIFDITRILITGCGDSYAAGLAMKPAIERLAGVPVEVLTAIDLARYTPAELLGRQRGSTLVLAVSNSGAVARVAEAIERAGRYGCLTLAVTGRPESRLAKAAKKTAGLSIPSFEAGNGVRSYLVSMLALLLIGIRMGEVKGRYLMADAQRWREQICGCAQDYGRVLEQIDTQMLGVAEKNAQKTLFDFVGSGGSYASAWFSQAKIIEATGDCAACADTEGWLHLNCFFRELSGRFTMLYASANGPELSRSLETIDAIAQMGANLHVVTDSKELPLPDGVERILLPSCPEGWMWPLFNTIPASLLAGYLCELKGEAYGRGCRDSWAVCGTTDLLTGSRIEIL